MKIGKILLSVLALILALFALVSCKIDKYPVYVEMKVKDHGVIMLELDPASAPKTVSHFVGLVEDGFYDGLTFHRVMSGFMIQGGASEKSAGTVKGEFSSNGYKKNNISHKRGVISMARSDDPNSATSQFFICNADSTFLDGDYAAFGRVVEGLAVVDSITTKTEPYANVYYNNIILSEANRAVIEYARVRKDYTPPSVPENVEPPESPEESDEPYVEEKPIYAEMKVAEHGTLIIELCPTAAPITVANFITLAEEGFYDGLTFHRVIDSFMIQGGDPDADGTGGSEEEIYGEFDANGHPNPIKHERGVISMARSNDPDSASSQFFIMHKAAPHLDGSYAAFGRVISGIEVVDSVVEATAELGDANGTIRDKSLQAVIEYVKILKDYTPAE